MSPPTPLPSHPSLEHLKNQADDLRRAQPDVSAAQALYMVARTYGFESWPALKRHVATLTATAHSTKETPMPTADVLVRKQLYTFTFQFAALMKSGVPILEALDACAETASVPEFKRAILGIKTSLREGQSLAAEFKRYPAHFDGLYVQMLSAGEETGRLDEMLLQLAIMIEKGTTPPPLAIFFRQLSVMQNAALPVTRSLAIIAEHTAPGPLKAALPAVERDIAGGVPVHEALARHPEVFDAFAVTMVRAGINGGVLGQQLQRVADHLEHSAAFGRV